jgi:uncharacterized protein with von Willebrand factor type A (vWA) domain
MPFVLIRYTEWDGTQQINFPGPEDLVDHLSEAMLNEESLEMELQRLRMRGMTSEDGERSVPGLRELIAGLEKKKKDLLNRYSPDSFKLNPQELRALAQKMEQISRKVQESYGRLQELFDQMRSRYRDEMDELQDKLSELSRNYETLRKRLKEQLERRSLERGKRTKGEQAARLAAMLDRINRMLESENFAAQLPSRLDASVENFENLLRNLDRLTNQDLSELGDWLSDLEELERLLQQYQFGGSQMMSTEQARALLRDVDTLNQLLEIARGGVGDLDDVDLEQVRRLLGDQAYEQFRYLTQIETMLQEAGYLVRGPEGLSLTPRAIRHIGDKALKEIFRILGDSRPGGHGTAQAGAQGENLEETKTYEFGDRFSVNVPKTLKNALLRGGRLPVQIRPVDFEVHRQEFHTRADTVLCIDVSYSMLMNDGLAAGKRVALALHRLIQSKFPEDTLQLVAFRSNAKIIHPEDLPRVVSITYSLEHGTDIKEALRFSRFLLSKNQGANRQVILITDGEPTAATMDRGGRLHGGWSSFRLNQRIVAETLKEAHRCTQDGININTFMIGYNPVPNGFVEHMTRINKGRVFMTSAERMGEYLLFDYLAKKKKWIGRS